MKPPVRRRPFCRRRSAAGGATDMADPNRRRWNVLREAMRRLRCGRPSSSPDRTWTPPEDVATDHPSDYTWDGQPWGQAGTAAPEDEPPGPDDHPPTPPSPTVGQPPRRRRRRWPWRRARRRTRPGRSAAAAVVDARVVPKREWCIWGGRWSGGRRVGIHGWARVPARRRRSREAAAASSVAVEKGGRHRAGVIQTKSEGRGVIRHGSPRLHNKVTTHEAKGAVLDQLSKPTRSLPFRSTSLNTNAIRACRAYTSGSPTTWHSHQQRE